MTPEEAHNARNEKRARKMRLYIIGIPAKIILTVLGIFLFKDADFSTIPKEGKLHPLIHPWGTALVFAVGVYFLIAYVFWGKIKTPSPSGDPPPDPSGRRHPRSVDPTKRSGLPGNLARFLIFLIFHAVVGWLVWKAVDVSLYEALGHEGFFKSLIDLALILLLGASIWSSVDATTIELNHAGQILYFNKLAFKNVPSGFIFLGLPKWLLVTIQTISIEEDQITIGLEKDGKREELKLERKDVEIVVDAAFKFRAMDTELVIGLEGDRKKAEKMMVTEANAAINRFVNALAPDQSGDKAGSLRYPDINSLKASTAIISKAIMEEPQTEANRGQTLREKFAEIGFYLASFTIKDIRNADDSIIKAAQRLAAGKIDEEREMLDVQNTGKKVQDLFASLKGTRILTAEQEEELMELCRQTVLEKEHGRQVVKILQGDEGSGKGKKRRGGGGNVSPTPIIPIPTPPPPSS